ncbi:hypothetical protein CL614_07995 [archaeon]|jgi:hypothetical protein|nr:hypothetical protein [archaeon]|tara:strand:+ start:948 stop:1319 length:372 start_codon:yes stop_codon:yes gene_type:complete
MSNFESNFKTLFEGWRSFINEGMKWKSNSIEAGDDNKARAFIELFVKSEQSAILALQLLDETISAYRRLKTSSIDSDSYRDDATFTLGDSNTVEDDEVIEGYIAQFEIIKKEVNEMLVNFQNK